MDGQTPGKHSLECHSPTYTTSSEGSFFSLIPLHPCGGITFPLQIQILLVNALFWITLESCHWTCAISSCYYVRFPIPSSSIPSTNIDDFQFPWAIVKTDLYLSFSAAVDELDVRHSQLPSNSCWINWLDA